MKHSQIQYSDLSEKAKSTLFAARKVHGFQGKTSGE